MSIWYKNGTIQKPVACLQDVVVRMGSTHLVAASLHSVLKCN